MLLCNQDKEIENIENETQNGTTPKLQVNLSKGLKLQLTNLKENANESLLNNKNENAIEIYSKAVKLFEENYNLSENKEDLKEIQEIYVTVLSNLSQTYLNMNDFGLAVQISKKAISVDQMHLKSYFRLGRAYKFHKKIPKNV